MWYGIYWAKSAAFSWPGEDIDRLEVDQAVAIQLPALFIDQMPTFTGYAVSLRTGMLPRHQRHRVGLSGQQRPSLHRYPALHWSSTRSHTFERSLCIFFTSEYRLNIQINALCSWLASWGISKQFPSFILKASTLCWRILGLHFRTCRGNIILVSIKCLNMEILLDLWMEFGVKSFRKVSFF